jgi:hypothetical protein
MIFRRSSLQNRPFDLLEFKMAHKKRSLTPEDQWEQALLDAYYDYRWREVLEPLYQKFQQWKAGELDHMDMDEAIHQTHKQTQEVYVFFTQKRDLLVRVIQFDESWFQPWVKDNPPPEGYLLG